MTETNALHVIWESLKKGCAVHMVDEHRRLSISSPNGTVTYNTDTDTWRDFTDQYSGSGLNTAFFFLEV